jgi:3-hydroxyacyl-CoA dehydrogenase
MGLLNKIKDFFNRNATTEVSEEAKPAFKAEPVTPPSDIKHATVVGAGVMGSGIAAQLANAGVKVLLLDIIPKPRVSLELNEKVRSLSSVKGFDPSADTNNPEQYMRRLDLFITYPVAEDIKEELSALRDQIKTDLDTQEALYEQRPSLIAEEACTRLAKANFQQDPMACGLMSPENVKRITPGNVEHHMKLIADTDLIIETVPENMAIKNATYDNIEQYRKPGTIIASNTSTLPLKVMAEGRDDSFKEDFMIMHFFNPPRLMPLVELVAGEKTRPEAMEVAEAFCNVHLGKTVVECQDTPGFLGNRIGTFVIKRALNEAFSNNLDIEDVDAVMGRPMGFPKMGIFGLVDTVGLDVSHHVTGSLKGILEKEDPFQDIAYDLPLLDTMIKRGTLGRKTKAEGGFYRKGAAGKESIDLSTGEYRASKKSSLASVKAGKKGLRAVLEHEDTGGKFAWEVMRDSLTYAASLVPEIGDNLDSIDEAMRAGYNWKYGPFEMIDQLGNENETGAEYLARRLTEEGKDVPELLTLAGGHPFYMEKDGVRSRLTFDFDNKTIDYAEIKDKEGVLDLKKIKKTSEPILGNEAGTLWDLGDGVVCAELHGMKGSLDPSTMSFLNDSMDYVDQNDNQKSMVVYSDADNFAVGANLGLVSFVANLADQDKLDDVLYDGQKTLERIKYAPFPVVAATGGMALGGGCEILLHCDSIQAHAESYIGLVEVGVGIIPGWGGCKEYLRRSFEHSERNPNDFTTPEIRAFETIAMATVSSSAQDAQNKLFLRPHDEISMNRTRLLNDAKKKALNLVPEYKAPEPGQFRLGGQAQNSIYRMAVDDMNASGLVTWHDVRVTDKLGRALSGGDTDLSKTLTDEDMLRVERESFAPLIQSAQTRARVKQMVTTNRPLRETPLTNPLTTKELRASLPSVTLQERPLVTPWQNAGNDENSTPSLDTSKMKPMDAIIATLESISALPAANTNDEKLAAVFNEAAMETRDGTIARLKKNRGMASFLPKEKLKSEVLTGFEKSIAKGEAKLSEGPGAEEEMKLKASVETMKHYKKVVSGMNL